MEKSLSHNLIPGGAHTYSKGDDQFPANAPRYLERGEGVMVWDRDGNEYLDWSMALSAISLGYGVKPVIEAAIEQMWKGSNFIRPSHIETDLAQDLVDLIPSAEMVKFAKNGSTVTTAAVKLARAHTGRDMVALCGDHPFFSYDDWFIATTVCDSGIPESTKSLSLTFRYNDIGSVENLFRENPGKIACLILEPAAFEHPRDGFLAKLAALCRENGTVFILDEMVSGFRWHLNGAQTYYDVTPDLCTFGKGLGNGFSLAALCGRGEIMELGGLYHDRKRVFLISTTHGAENHSLAAGRAVLKIYREEPVIETMWSAGGKLIEGLNQAAAAAGMGDNFKASGVPCRPIYLFTDGDGAVSMPLRTLFLQEMIRRGILIPYINPSFAHGDGHVARTVEAAAESLKICARALDDGWEKYLEGEAAKPVFRLYN